MFAQFDWGDALRNSPILMVLVGCSMLSLGAAIDRVLYYRRRKGDADLLLAKVADRLRRRQVDEALKECEGNKHPLGSVAHRVIESLKNSGGNSEEYLQIGLSEEKLLLERNLSILGSMAAIAPLIGLLGTVWGIMRAFHDMAITGSAAPSVVAAGVAEALTTTAAGLIVAVPAVLLYNHFNRRMTVMLTVSENHARGIRAVFLESQNGKSKASDSKEIGESIMQEIQSTTTQPEFIS